MSSVPQRPDLAVVQVGDVVRIGKGKTLWRVESFWTGYEPDRPLARLAPLTGYTHTSCEVDHLTLIDRPVDTRAPGTGEVPC